MARSSAERPATRSRPCSSAARASARPDERKEPPWSGGPLQGEASTTTRSSSIPLAPEVAPTRRIQQASPSRRWSPPETPAHHRHQPLVVPVQEARARRPGDVAAMSTPAGYRLHLLPLAALSSSRVVPCLHPDHVRTDYRARYCKPNLYVPSVFINCESSDQLLRYMY
jgi:hypothetical protein